MLEVPSNFLPSFSATLDRTVGRLCGGGGAQAHRLLVIMSHPSLLTLSGVKPPPLVPLGALFFCLTLTSHFPNAGPPQYPPPPPPPQTCGLCCNYAELRPSRSRRPARQHCRCCDGPPPETSTPTMPHSPQALLFTTKRLAAPCFRENAFSLSTGARPGSDGRPPRLPRHTALTYAAACQRRNKRSTAAAPPPCTREGSRGLRVFYGMLL